jgi:hypothetical protein
MANPGCQMILPAEQANGSMLTRGSSMENPIYRRMPRHAFLENSVP